MKKLLIIVLLSPLFALAQKKHTVAPKESFTSIGRMYNVNGRELANYNNLDYNKGLSIGQVINIPPNASVPVKTETVKAEEPKKETVTTGRTPIYHTVAKKETLYHISTLYNKVPIADIKKWNNLTGDGVNEGARLIVGYSDKPATEKYETVKDVTKKETKYEPPVPPVVMKEEEKEEIKNIPPPQVIPDYEPPKTAAHNGGNFKDIFKGNASPDQTGTGGVFKSNSGWQDGRYYCLHNTAPEGSIIKITNQSGKSIYAKVLDVMPDIKQNAGLIILISNAAASELGVGENKFDCTVTYSK